MFLYFSKKFSAFDSIFFVFTYNKYVRYIYRNIKTNISLACTYVQVHSFYVFFKHIVDKIASHYSVKTFSMLHISFMVVLTCVH